MKYDEHLPDEQLLLDMEGELSAHAEQLARAHLSACWKCRARKQELESAISDFVRVNFEKPLPPPDGPRAMLKAQLALLSSQNTSQPWFRLPWAFALCGAIILGLFLVRPTRHRPTIVSYPDARLTPGATLLVNRPSVCAQENVKNKAVPVALQRRVFEEYGIAGADPQAYEVDYLITPALGGADDIHNLWPHSYSATVWNAQVKDALEDRLRDMVCDGTMDLAEAQKEIAGNWIAAYKRYFHTDQPLADR